MSKHTPGPWGWDSQGYLWSGSDSNFEVANAGSVYRKEDRQLIAAAPDLLEAAKEVVRARNQFRDSPPEYKRINLDIHLTAMKELERAIKKVEGE